MASSSVSRDRTVCETCELPFYADSEACPYCDADAAGIDSDDGGFVFEESGPAERMRTTCPTCGLPHYADAEACPYCERAGGSVTVTDSPDGPTETTASADERSGLFGRIKRTLGF